MKTVINQLVETLDGKNMNAEMLCSDKSLVPLIRTVIQLCKEEAEKLIESEKEQMNKAYNQGNDDYHYSTRSFEGFYKSFDDNQ